VPRRAAILASGEYGHADLETLNELSFARFDARLEQRLGEPDARIGRFEIVLERSFGGIRSDLRAELAEQCSLNWSNG
jgi:hypothetical protein